VAAFKGGPVLFSGRKARTEPRSLRIQTKVSNRTFIFVSFSCLPFSGRFFRSSSSSSSWHFVWRAAGQLHWPWLFSGIPRRWGHFGPRTSRRVFLRRLRWLPRFDRRIFLRLDRHGFFPELPRHAPTALGRQGSLLSFARRVQRIEIEFMTSSEACYCGSCRSPRSRARACRQYSHRSIRFATDARSPPRAAIAMAGLP
jgi:hypothetical protein